jgi:hypothetical protein
MPFSFRQYFTPSLHFTTLLSLLPIDFRHYIDFRCFLHYDCFHAALLIVFDAAASLFISLIFSPFSRLAFSLLRRTFSLHAFHSQVSQWFLYFPEFREIPQLSRRVSLLFQSVSVITEALRRTDYWPFEI